MNDIVIRPILPSQRQEWRVLWFESHAAVDFPPKRPSLGDWAKSGERWWERLHEPTSNESTRGVFIYHKGVLAGAAHYTQRQLPPSLYVDLIYLRKEHRGQGLVEATMEWMRQQANTLNCSRLYGYANVNNRAGGRMSERMPNVVATAIPGDWKIIYDFDLTAPVVFSGPSRPTKPLGAPPRPRAAKRRP